MLTSCQPAGTDPIRIIVDDRERRSEVAGCLQRNGGVQVTFRRLRVGDYIVQDLLVVERKTMTDFAVSLCSGRLFRQAYQLRTSVAHRRVCMVLEGPDENLERMRISREAVQGALLNLTLVFDLPILHSSCQEETAKVILIAAKQIRRREAALVHRWGPRPRDIRRMQLLMLQSVTGIGPVKAAAVLDRLGSPAGAAEASLEQLEGVDGIGPVTAARLHTVFHNGSRT